MLKLIKHELKAVASEFYGISIALFALALFGPILLRSDSPSLILMTVLALFAVVIAVSVVTFLVTLKVLNNRLYGDIGYLQHTLPVSSTKLLFSKLLVAVIIQLVIALVFTLAFGVFLLMLVILYQDGISSFVYLKDMIFKSDLLGVILKEVIILAPKGLISWFYSMNILLFVTSFVNTSWIRNNKLVIGIILFIVLSMGLNGLETYLFPQNIVLVDVDKVLSSLVSVSDPVVVGNALAQGFNGVAVKILLLNMAYQLVWSGLIFSGTQYLVERKLEI